MGNDGEREIIDECEFCAGETLCGARLRGEDREWICMRPPYHEGEHIACGTRRHDMHRWPQDEEAA